MFVEVGSDSVSFEDTIFFTVDFAIVFFFEGSDVFQLGFVGDSGVFAIAFVGEFFFVEVRDFLVLLWDFGIVSRVVNKKNIFYSILFFFLLSIIS
jgi:hypothetical protein